MAEVAGELDRETLRRLKRECGGLQTLLRNSPQVFQGEARPCAPALALALGAPVPFLRSDCILEGSRARARLPRVRLTRGRSVAHAALSLMLPSLRLGPRAQPHPVRGVPLRPRRDEPAGGPLS